jgi:mannose-6-phosphate isomerase-like protein (cupin superfamily)
MFDISFDVVYKLKMGFKVIQKHDDGESHWRIVDGELQYCFMHKNSEEYDFQKAEGLVLDPKAKYSFEPEKVNKNEWY